MWCDARKIPDVPMPMCISECSVCVREFLVHRELYAGGDKRYGSQTRWHVVFIYRSTHRVLYFVWEFCARDYYCITYWCTKKKTRGKYVSVAVWVCLWPIYERGPWVHYILIHQVKLNTRLISRTHTRTYQQDVVYLLEYRKLFRTKDVPHTDTPCVNTTDYT